MAYGKHVDNAVSNINSFAIHFDIGGGRRNVVVLVLVHQSMHMSIFLVTWSNGDRDGNIHLQ